jgi:hypothetical protein
MSLKPADSISLSWHDNAPAAQHHRTGSRQATLQRIDPATMVPAGGRLQHNPHTPRGVAIVAAGSSASSGAYRENAKVSSTTP